MQPHVARIARLCMVSKWHGSLDLSMLLQRRQLYGPSKAALDVSIGPRRNIKQVYKASGTQVGLLSHIGHHRLILHHHAHPHPFKDTRKANHSYVLGSSTAFPQPRLSLQLLPAATVAAAADAAFPGKSDHNPDEHSLVNFEHTAGSFLELAQERFEARNGRPATSEEETWTLEGLQLVRVPKAGSSEISLIARRLGGCTPRGPCCNWPGDPPGSCPAKGLMCPAVVGCTGHHMGDKKLAELKDANVFSMTSVRGVVDRMVSGFFYAAPHSPGCAHKEVVHYKGCFTTMTTSPAFQNVMAKMFTGQYAYEGATTLCLDKQQGSEGGGECSVDLEAAIQGACNLNFVAMCEIWESSVLLLFETLPWLGPTSDFFPIHAADSVVAEEPRLKVHENGDGAAVVQRQNTGARHEEGIKHITPELREAASHANSVDEALHEFLSAKFCDRLKEAGLLEEPLVARELATYEVLDRRCNDYTWVNNTLERYKPLTPEDCRLYRPFVRP